jgi:prophage DNA circulation protein
MADWKDNLRRVTLPDGRILIGASFRGVPFFVDSQGRGGGKRLVKHSYPYKKNHFVEDLGPKEQTFQVQGYVLGDDYLEQKEALLAALEQDGPGTLVLPYEGTKKAICETWGVQQTKSDGRIATFALEFCETPSQSPLPTAVDDGAAQVSTAADSAIAAAKAEFKEKYSAAGLPAFALASAETALVKATATIDAKLAPLVADAQELALFKSKIAIITARASSLVRTPDDVIESVQDAIVGLGTTIENAPGQVLVALANAYFDELGELVTAITATRERESTNQAALTAALRRVFAIEAARLAPLVPYASTDEALATRDTLGAILDEQAELAGDTAYPAIVALRSAILQRIPGSSKLASITTITQATPIPSLLLAYKLYGSVDRAEDIVARNGIAHPGFVAGDLKVLGNG